jgi:hypothetical protein
MFTVLDNVVSTVDKDRFEKKDKQRMVLGNTIIQINYYRLTKDVFHSLILYVIFKNVLSRIRTCAGKAHMISSHAR